MIDWHAVLGNIPETTQEIDAELATLAHERAALEADLTTEQVVRAADKRNRTERDKAADVAERARRGAAGALNNVHTHLQRAGARNATADEQRSEERLALASFQRAKDWGEIDSAMRSLTKVTEPDIYSRTSPNSWFADVAALHLRHGDVSGAEQRLAAYGKDLARDFGKAGVRARKAWREAARKDADLRERSDMEYRAMTTGSASGGSLVPPDYLEDDYALYREVPPTFLDRAVTTLPLPDHGMEVDVPRITGPAGVTAQSSENTAVDEADPTATFATEPVQTFSGKVTASQQLHDRGGPLTFDQVVYAQLRQELDATVDTALIVLALAGAQTIARTTSTTLTLAQLQSDVGQAAAALQTQAGVRLAPLGVFGAASIIEWLLAQTDATSHESWFRPSLGAQRDDTGDTGQSVAGIRMYVDDSIPATSSHAQLLVPGRGAVRFYAGAPTFDVLEGGGLAGSLSVIYRVRQYGVPLSRYPTGVAAVSGSGYPSSPVFS